VAMSARNVVILLAKDLRLQWRTALALLVFEVLAFATFVAQFPEPMRATSGTFLQGIASIGTFIMGYRILASEERSGAISFLKGLPLSTDEIYGSKFLFVYTYALANVAALNGAFLLLGGLLPWEVGVPTLRAVVIGALVQLVFAWLLVGTATLINSEKAIWVPFPLVVLLVNGYAILSSDGRSGLAQTLAQVAEHWAWLAAAAVVLLAAGSLAVMAVMRSKRSLAS
jgi:predicted permease